MAASKRRAISLATVVIIYRHSGARAFAREPGIHTHCLWLWIPDNLAEPAIGPRDFARARWLGFRNDEA
jgi:hypothetical protein